MNKVAEAVELYRNFRIKHFIHHNHEIIARSPLPKKKKKIHELLTIQASINRFNAREKFDAAYKKLNLAEQIECRRLSKDVRAI